MKRRINFIIATILLFSVCLLGQILCDAMGYEQILGRYLLRTVIFCGMCVITYFLVRFLHRAGRIRRVLSWIFGILIIGWGCRILIFTVETAVDDYVFTGDGWTLSRAFVSEDFQYMADLTHWFGRVDAYYQYSDEDAVMPYEPEDREKEPYLSAMLERSKAVRIYRDYHGRTLLNVIGYMYGRWYIVLYIIAMLYWSVSAVLMLPLQRNRIRLAFMTLLMVPVMVSGWGVVLNASGICYICLTPVFAYANSMMDTLQIHWPFMVVFTAEVMNLKRV